MNITNLAIDLNMVSRDSKTGMSRKMGYLTTPLSIKLLRTLLSQIWYEQGKTGKLQSCNWIYITNN